jgi:hypothetical protein
MIIYTVKYFNPKSKKPLQVFHSPLFITAAKQFGSLDSMGFEVTLSKDSEVYYTTEFFDSYKWNSKKRV